MEFNPERKNASTTSGRNFTTKCGGSRRNLNHLLYHGCRTLFISSSSLYFLHLLFLFLELSLGCSFLYLLLFFVIYFSRAPAPPGSSKKNVAKPLSSFQEKKKIGYSHRYVTTCFRTSILI